MPERSSDDMTVNKRARGADGGRRSCYHDFELEIGIGIGRQYPVAVINSPAGQARETMVFPYDEVNLDSRLKDLKVALLRSGGSRRQILTPEEAAVQGFGKDIFDALLSGEARSLYDMSVQQAREDGKGLRLKLRILPPELARLPWEYLYDDRHAEYVSLSRETPVVRFLESRRPTQPLSVTPPLQILGMIASPSDLPPLDTGRERKRVEQALTRLESNGLVDLTWIETPTWRELQRAMRAGPWHVFHFIGHGGFDRVAGEGVVALADDDGRSHNLSATELGRLLADHNALRLAVLNSCEGATSSDEDVFSSTAAVLVRRGIPAVLAMQYEITDRAAIEFARTFYESLADGYPVDGAVAEARKAVSLAVTNTIEWGTPVLFMRTADGVVFDLPAGPDLASQMMPIDSGDDAEAERLDALYTEGLSAFWVSDWARASQRFKAITDIRPDYSDAATRLEEAQRQLRWSALQSEVADARASEDWPAAIAALQELQADGAPFGDVPDLLADCQRRQEIADLFSQAGQLEAAEHWPAAVNVLTKLRQLAPDSTDAVKMLARAQAEVAELDRVAHLGQLYSRAVRAMDSGDWAPAKEALREIIDTEPDYRDAAGLVVRCDAELRPGTRELEPVANTPASAEPSAVRPRNLRPGRRFWPIAVGTLLGALVLLAALIFTTRQGDDARPETTPADAPAATTPDLETAVTTPDVDTAVTEVVLNATGSSSGLTLSRGGDSDVEVVTVDQTEERAWGTGNGRVLPAADGNTVEDWYMTFDVDDDFVFEASPTSHVQIEIEFLDEGTDEFLIEYDSNDNSVADAGRYKESEIVRKTGTGEFRTAAFELDDAYFGNRTNLGDFRLNDVLDGAEIVRRVTVTLN